MNASSNYLIIGDSTAENQKIQTTKKLFRYSVCLYAEKLSKLYKGLSRVSSKESISALVVDRSPLNLLWVTHTENQQTAKQCSDAWVAYFSEHAPKDLYEVWLAPQKVTITGTWKGHKAHKISKREISDLVIPLARLQKRFPELAATISPKQEATFVIQGFGERYEEIYEALYSWWDRFVRVRYTNATPLHSVWLKPEESATMIASYHQECEKTLRALAGKENKTTPKIRL